LILGNLNRRGDLSGIGLLGSQCGGAHEQSGY
jgi:hypothetical protein